jgi:hypothetical protein
LPIIMPNMVKLLRILFAINVVTDILMLSKISIMAIAPLGSWESNGGRSNPFE